MILIFACKETEGIWSGILSRKLPGDIQECALRKLRQLDAARTMDELKLPPSNHLEMLRGNRKGQMSIRINQQWRVCFVWSGTDAREVEIVDYH
jgi:proteic killer suppression protein